MNEHSPLVQSETSIINQAIAILMRRIRKSGNLFLQPEDVVKLLKLSTSELEHEVFGVILLDTSQRYITHEVLFRGTLLYTAVPPREVVKFALKHNASRVILYHNHPGGSTRPSPSDIDLTKKLYDILNVVDVLVIDHIIIAKGLHVSLNQLGVMPT